MQQCRFTITKRRQPGNTAELCKKYLIHLSQLIPEPLLLFLGRVVFGPELVMLCPDEQFTQLSLSGGKPKKPNVIKALCLLLGPDFCTDIVTVETSDHARLQLQLSYNW